jgi:hypothetical protein
MQTHSFAELIKGLHYAVNSVQEMLKAQQISMIREYFDDDGVVLTQRIKTLKNETVDIPLISLVPQTSIMIDEIEIKFATKVDSIVENEKSQDQKGETAPESLRFNMSLAASATNSGDVMNVTVKFKAASPPEGLSRMIDEYSKAL